MSSEANDNQVAEIAANYDISDFIDGQKACRDGAPHQAGMSESFTAGYSTQYQLEQINANR